MMAFVSSGATTATASSYALSDTDAGYHLGRISADWMPLQYNIIEIMLFLDEFWEN